MPFQGFTLTEFGHKMLGKALIGKPLHLTRAALGDGVLTEEIPGMTALCGERMSTLLSGVLMLADHEARIRALEDALFNDISKNPWSVRFENLTGLLVTGVWSVDKRHITC